MENVSYNDIIKVLMELVKDKDLANIIFVSGGIVPWLVSKRDSNRNHDDIDLIVLQKNMSKIREFLNKNNLYDSSLDSLSYEESKEIDYGVVTNINGISIGFYPCEQKLDGSIIQRSFTLKKINGKKDLKVKIIPNLILEDYFSKTTLPNGDNISISSLEVIKVMKEKVGREKDLHDINEINRIGYDLEKYKRVKKAIDNMENI